MENVNVTLSIGCDPKEGLRLTAYISDSDGMVVEFVDVPADSEVNLIFSKCNKKVDNYVRSF